MLAALALATILNAPVTVELTPSDDIWVYPHASDPQADPFLRVWGAEGKETAKDINELQDFSYSYVRFDLSTVPEGKVTGATLTVTCVPNPGYDLAYSKQNPLRARALSPEFSEKKWDYSKVEQLMPDGGDKVVFGFGSPTSIAADKEFKIVLDLLKGPNDFKSYVANGRTSKLKAIAMALTASLDVEERGQGSIYKFYSKDCETAAKRPVLKLTIEP